jgi:hypothetical protein
MEQTKVKIETSAHAIGLLITILISGCAGFERSPSSGYAYQNNGSGVTAFQDRELDRHEAAINELGSAPSSEAIQNRKLLKRYESELHGKSEKEQYYNAKPLFKSDSERIRFLSLNSSNERERFLEGRSLANVNFQHPPIVQQLIDENDIAAGMTKQAVKDSWGTPDEVLVAGNPMYGNEHWTYREQVTSSEGYMTETRTVFFEGGLVVGWSTK